MMELHGQKLQILALQDIHLLVRLILHKLLVLLLEVMLRQVKQLLQNLGTDLVGQLELLWAQPYQLEQGLDQVLDP
jgi:hypothetical protein